MLLALILALLSSYQATSYHSVKYRVRVGLHSGSKDDLGGDSASQALFTLTETFGKLISPQTRKKEDVEASKDGVRPSALTFEEIGQRIKEEYENLFWVTGKMDTSLWADDCYFADPFSSFGGPGSSGSTARFEANAKNLGKLVLNPKSRVTSFEVDVEEYSIKIGWTFSSKLNLPWRPVLAASGVTSHYLSKDTMLIEKYLESWKSKPWDVVKRLFVPTKADEEEK